MIKELNENNFDEEIKSGLKLVEFEAPWCSFCQKQQPILEELEKIWIGQVDSDKSPKLMHRFHIKGFPTFVIFKDGKEVGRFSGWQTKFNIMDQIAGYIK